MKEIVGEQGKEAEKKKKKKKAFPDGHAARAAGFFSGLSLISFGRRYFRAAIIFEGSFGGRSKNDKAVILFKNSEQIQALFGEFQKRFRKANFEEQDAMQEEARMRGAEEDAKRTPEQDAKRTPGDSLMTPGKTPEDTRRTPKEEPRGNP